MPPAILAENLTYRYPNGYEALKNVNLEIEAGGTAALIGRNGAGKTTLAKHFNSLLKPTTGRVMVDGIDASNHSTSQMARTVGYVFQNPEDQLFGSTVREEVAFGPKNLGMDQDEIKQCVDKALSTVGLSSFVSEHPYNMNYGQRKMLCLASILAMNPKIIIMDEPNAGQDYGGLRLLASIIDRLKREDKTILVISHDMEFVAEHCKRTILMAGGTIVGYGLTRQMLSERTRLGLCGVRPPQVTRLAINLSPHGVSHDIMTVQEMTDELMQRKGGGK